MPKKSKAIQRPHGKLSLRLVVAPRPSQNLRKQATKPMPMSAKET